MSNKDFTELHRLLSDTDRADLELNIGEAVKAWKKYKREDKSGKLDIPRGVSAAINGGFKYLRALPLHLLIDVAMDMSRHLLASEEFSRQFKELEFPLDPLSSVVLDASRIEWNGTVLYVDQENDWR